MIRAIPTVATKLTRLGGFCRLWAMSDQRSQAAREFRAWYKARAWALLRRDQLNAEPWCAMCLEAKQRTFATVVDHRTPHRGDRALFFDATNLQSLCDTHHSGSKQREERNGFSSAVDDDGWPTDPRHPANR